MTGRLHIAPVSFREATAYVKEHHRHHAPPRGHKFSVGVRDDAGELRGVAMIGRPVARALDDGLTLEVNRVATDGAKNACSALYGAAWRAARALGYRRLVTYTLATEPGTSLHASGWKLIGEVKGRSWSCPSRPREDRGTTQDKKRWEVSA